MIRFEDLTKAERNVIAEYIYSFYSSVLIIQDAQNVLQLFKTKNIDVSKVKIDEESVLKLIFKHVDASDRNKMMDEYYTTAFDFFKQ